MKKNRSKAFRSARSGNAGPQDCFFVDSISALKDVLANKPQLIIDVSDHVRKDVDVSKVKGEIAFRTYDDSFERRPVARVKVPMLDWSDLESNLKHESDKTSMICALNGVQDPRNLGAIIRTAAFFGVESVLIPQRRQVQLTQAAIATAQGGYAITDLVSVVNLARSLEILKTHGYWIVGAAMDGVSIQEFRSEHNLSKLVVVLGSEGEGLTHNIRNKCDFIVSITGGNLDSLNVSVAAGIFFHGLK